MLQEPALLQIGDEIDGGGGVKLTGKYNLDWGGGGEPGW